MIGGARFAWARARAVLPSLLTVALAAAIVAALLVGAQMAVSVLETRETRAALTEAQSGAGTRVTAQVGAAEADEGEAATTELETAVRRILGRHGDPPVVLTPSGAGLALVPDATRFTGGDVGALDDALRALPEEARDLLGTRVQVSGALAGTLRSIGSDLQARRGPTAVAIAFLALSGILVVGAVAVDPLRGRATELRLLRARGARAGSLARASAAEAGAVALVGAAIGAGVSFVVGAILSAPPPDPILAVAAVLAVAVSAAVSAGGATLRVEVGVPARARLAAGSGLAVIVAVVTALAVWRFLQDGSPIVVRGDGSAFLDPLVAVAPALVLAVTALLTVLATAPLARAAGSALRSTRGVRPVMPLRLFSRRPLRHVLAIVVVAFTVGSASVAVAYSGTAQDLGDAPEALRVGADVRVTTIPDTLRAVDVAQVARHAGAEAVSLGRAFTALGPGSRLPVLALEGSAVGDVMQEVAGVDAAALEEAIRLRGTGVPVAGDSLEVTVSAPLPPPVEWEGERFQPERLLANVRFTFLSDTGGAWTFAVVNGDVDASGGDEPLGGTAEPETTLRIPLPTTDGGAWSLAAIDMQPVSWGTEGTIVVSGARSGGEDVDLSALAPAPGTAGTVEVGAAVTFAPAADGGGDPVRALADGVPRAAPVVMTEALAADLSLAVGDTVALEFDGPDFEAEVTIGAVVPVLPGAPAGRGLLADIDALGLLSPVPLTPNQVWAAAGDPDMVAEAVSEEFGAVTVLVADPRQASAVAASSALFVLAAGGVLALTLLILLLRRARTRADDRELALLAVLGLGRRRAAGVRIGEDLTALGAGVVGGAVSGVVTAWLVVPSLVRAAYGDVPAAFPVPLVWLWGPWAVAVAVVAASCAAVIATVRAPRGLAVALREDE